MQKFLTDMHTHSTYSHDGRAQLQDMLAKAQAKGIAFFGVSEHFDYDYDLSKMTAEQRQNYGGEIDAEEYFHGARHLQEDYAGVMNVFIGAEFGYSDDVAVQNRYRETVQKYAPDFIINSVHSVDGLDFYYQLPDGEKGEIFKEYLSLIRRSLDADYPYDIVGHLGYIARYIDCQDKSFAVQEYQEQIQDILTAIIQKDKILEVNSASKALPYATLPERGILQWYYQLGGRKISFGSDAHNLDRIADKRDEVAETLKEIGFTHVVVPCRGEHIKVEL